MTSGIGLFFLIWDHILCAVIATALWMGNDVRNCHYNVHKVASQPSLTAMQDMQQNDGHDRHQHEVAVNVRHHSTYHLKSMSSFIAPFACAQSLRLKVGTDAQFRLICH